MFLLADALIVAFILWLVYRSAFLGRGRIRLKKIYGVAIFFVIFLVLPLQLKMLFILVVLYLLLKSNGYKITNLYHHITKELK